MTNEEMMELPVDEQIINEMSEQELRAFIIKHHQDNRYLCDIAVTPLGKFMGFKEWQEFCDEYLPLPEDL